MVAGDESLINQYLGRLFRFRGQIVKARWCNGDDEWALLDYGPDYDPGQDEPGIFVYEDGKEKCLAVIDLDDGELFDVSWEKKDNGKLRFKKTIVGLVDELQSIDDSWIDGILQDGNQET